MINAKLTIALSKRPEGKKQQQQKQRDVMF